MSPLLFHFPMRRAAISAALLLASAAHAETGPFTGLAGSWSGGGTVALAGGPKERITCRANYAVGGGGANLRQSLRCASDSYRFDLTSDVQDQGGQLTGTWSEASRNVQGALFGQAQGGGRLQVSVNGPGFVANVSLITQGDRQTVTVNAQGNESAGASITLNRSK
jgi:hypothetical protein